MPQFNRAAWIGLVAKRFAILLALALTAWPLLLVVKSLQPVLANAVLFDTYWQLAGFTFTNVVAVVFAVSLIRVLNHLHPSNPGIGVLFGDGSRPWGARRLCGAVALAVIAPLYFAFHSTTELGEGAHAPKYWVYVLLSVLAAAGVAVVALAALGRLKSMTVGSEAATANFFPFEAIDAKGIPVLRRIKDRLTTVIRCLCLSPADLQLVMYFVLLGACHTVLLPLIDGDRYVVSSAPTAFVLLLWVGAMLCAGLARVCDRWRVPVVVVVALLIAVRVWMQGSTSTFRTAPVAALGATEHRDGDPGVEDIQWDAVRRRMNRINTPLDSEKGRTLVIATCPGGGIHAAAWSACVLDRLCEEYEEFKDSLCVISGVSGGSVGTLLFVGTRYHWELVSTPFQHMPEKLHDPRLASLRNKSASLEIATRSSLEPLAFGAMVDDLFGLSGSGRGERLEQAFAGRLSDRVRAQTLSEWGRRAMSGEVPVVVFNATDAVSGRRVLFDSVPTPPRNATLNQVARPLNYREILGEGRDVYPATAARISATFPYVTPFSRPDSPSDVERTVALCDGGYVDNEGIVTAVTWIEHLLDHWFEETKALRASTKDKTLPKRRRTFDRILLLRIEPALSVERPTAESGPSLHAAFRWLIGPLEAMMSVRSTSQVERGHLESDLIELFYDATSEELEPDESPEQDASPRRRIFERLRRRRGNAAAEESSSMQSASPQPTLNTRREWGMRLDEVENLARETGSLDPPRGVADQHVEAILVDRDTDAPVIVKTIRFYDADQSIPLSWKLSTRQKLGYWLSWADVEAMNPGLRGTLDRFFTRRQENSESSTPAHEAKPSP